METKGQQVATSKTKGIQICPTLKYNRKNKIVGKKSMSTDRIYTKKLSEYNDLFEISYSIVIHIIYLIGCGQRILMK